MWESIKNWGAPLWIFIVGELMFLILLLFFPTIDSTVNVTVNTTANVSSFMWGWEWVSSPGVVKGIVMAGYQIGLLFTVGYVFLKSKP